MEYSDVGVYAVLFHMVNTCTAMINDDELNEMHEITFLENSGSVFIQNLF